MLILDWTNAAHDEPQGYAFGPVTQLSYGAVTIILRRFAIFGRFRIEPRIGGTFRIARE